jgi:hypothetical protein
MASTATFLQSLGTLSDGALASSAVDGEGSVIGIFEALASQLRSRWGSRGGGGGAHSRGHRGPPAQLLLMRPAFVPPHSGRELDQSVAISAATLRLLRGVVAACRRGDSTAAGAAGGLDMHARTFLGHLAVVRQSLERAAPAGEA